MCTSPPCMSTTLPWTESQSLAWSLGIHPHVINSFAHSLTTYSNSCGFVQLVAQSGSWGCRVPTCRYPCIPSPGLVLFCMDGPRDVDLLLTGCPETFSTIQRHQSATDWVSWKFLHNLETSICYWLGVLKLSPQSGDINLLLTECPETFSTIWRHWSATDWVSWNFLHNLETSICYWLGVVKLSPQSGDIDLLLTGCPETFSTIWGQHFDECEES